jgi:hypothetical protein
MMRFYLRHALVYIFILFSLVAHAQDKKPNTTAGSPSEIKSIRICTPTSPKAHPLYLLKSGKKELHLPHLSEINPKQIQSVQVYKNQEAMKRYGKEAKYGIVVIEVDKATFRRVKKKEVSNQ